MISKKLFQTNMSENGSEKKEKQKKALELDLTNSTRDVWLVKVPKYISDRYTLYKAYTPSWGW